MPLDGAKKDYYTSAEAYRDDDGNMKQFTFIDHDVKTKIATGEKYDMEEIKNQRIQYRKDLVEEVLGLSASLCPLEYTDFILRGEDYTKVTWNEAMIRDEGLDLIKLVFLKNILSNRMEQVTKTY
jgi:hypothetical protein